MDFALLVIVTAVLRIRPTDIIPTLESFQLYYVAIVGCLLVSLGGLSRELSATFAGKRPITVLMLGILILIPISDAIHGEVEFGINEAIEYLKVVVYYLLLSGIVNTSQRLRAFVTWIILIDLLVTGLALLHFYGYLSIEAYNSRAGLSMEYDPLTETTIIRRRLLASGMFGDPNDFCQILNTSLMFCLGGLIEKGASLKRLGWLAPAGIFAFAILQTGSRGGLLGTLGGATILFWSRFGRRKTLLAMAVGLVLLSPLMKGRLAGLFSATEGTGQTRIQIWDSSFMNFRNSPILIGIGANRHGEVVGRATHNGFLCAFTELGLLGGAMFFGCFYSSIHDLWRLGSRGFVIEDPCVRTLRPYILAAMVSYTINEFSLTHPYNVVTYMMLGLSTACVQLGDPDHQTGVSMLSGKLIARISLLSVFFLVGLYLFVRVAVRY